MKTLFFMLALLLCVYLARVKTQSARSLMTLRNNPEMLVHPYQHLYNPYLPVQKV